MTLREAAMAALKEVQFARARASEREREESAKHTARLIKDRLGFDAEPNPGEGTATADGLEFRVYRSDGVTTLNLLQHCIECGGVVRTTIYDLASLGCTLNGRAPLCETCHHAQWYNPPSELEPSPAAVKLAQALLDALSELREEV